MQLNCKVIKKWQTLSPPPPQFLSQRHRFQGYPHILAKFLVPPKVNQFLKGPTTPNPVPPPFNKRRKGSNYESFQTVAVIF